MIKDKLVPDAINWFTGKALEEYLEDQEDEDGDDYYDDEDDENDEDDDDDDDDDEKEGAAKPECKQQ